jgi:type I restriction enzyme R subunit
MITYNIIASANESTVVAEYETPYCSPAEYQSEADLERGFIDQLCRQGYEYIQFHNEATLINNLRIQLEILNGIQFSDDEWERFFKGYIANANEGIADKTRKIQVDDSAHSLKRDDGSTKNVRLIDKNNIHNNRLQVINQYEETGGAHGARYDVTVLVNGLPLVHIELKRRGVALREAFNQIKRYQRDSFWSACGLYEYTYGYEVLRGV